MNLGTAINNRDQVLGLSLLPDNTTFHSFLWQEGVITDLGTLSGHPLTFPGGINNKGQVVGHSCDSTDTYCVAYLWENGVMTDLNTLISSGLSVYLYYAGDINDRGEIAGIAVDPVTGCSSLFWRFRVTRRTLTSRAVKTNLRAEPSRKGQASARE